MNKTELIEKVVEKTELSKKDAQKAVEAIFDTIMNRLANGDKVDILGFGSFAVKKRSARKGRNPSTGEEIEIPASKVPVMKPGKSLKEAVKNS